MSTPDGEGIVEHLAGLCSQARKVAIAKV